MGKPHASMTPNVVNAGETLTIAFDQSDDNDEVIVSVFEVDDQSPLEPAGAPKLLVTFHGSLASNKFSPTPSPDGKPNPNVPPVADPKAPTITIDLDGTKAQVALPDAQVEQGMFELRIGVDAKKPKAASFVGPDVVLVRAFQHFAVNGVPRPIITFVTGADNAGFFTAATEFWKLNGDAVIAKNGMSLAEVLSVLDSEGKKYGPWGQVNVVAHGREHVIAIKLFPDSPQTSLHVDGMNRDLSDHTSTPLATPSSLDGLTQVVFRACNAGRDQELVDAIKKNVFPAAKFVKVPRFPQFYEYTTTKAGTVAAEHFDDVLIFDRPTQAKALLDLQAGLADSFDERSGKKSGATDSPGLDPSAQAAQEIPTFKEVDDFTLALGDFDETVAESDVTQPGGAPMGNADLVALVRSKWDDFVPPLDKMTVTWKTEADRWTPSGVAAVPDPNAAEETKGVWLQVTKGIATPKFQQLSSGGTGIGTRTGDPTVWTVVAKGVADQHAIVSLNQSTLDQVEVQDGNNPGSSTIVVAGSRSQTLTAGAKAVVALPAQITVGQAVIALRRGRGFRLKFNGSRFFVDRRRVMRLFDAAKKYPDRDIVVPDLDNPLHYGTSH